MNFTNTDKELLSKALKQIQLKQRKALILRFWENYEIVEVAKALRVSWAEADRLIETGKDEIKKILLNKSGFSHSQEILRACEAA